MELSSFHATEAVVQCQCKIHQCQSLWPATLLKERLWHRCFPVNFEKFLRTPFLTEHIRWLLLEQRCSRVLFKWIELVLNMHVNNGAIRILIYRNNCCYQQSFRKLSLSMYFFQDASFLVVLLFIRKLWIWSCFSVNSVHSRRVET